MALPDFPPIPAELAVEEEPLTDDELDSYFAVMDAGPNAELRHDGSADPEMAEAVEVAAAVARWRVEDDGGAEWALRKMAEAQEDVARLAEQAQEWERRIRAWFVQASRKPERTVAVMEEKLADYALRLREVGGPATLTLPSGVIKTTEQKPKVEVEDEEAAATHVQAMLDVELAMPAGDEERPTPWADAWRESGIEGLEALVAWKPKVYVGPLRKLVKIGEEDDGWDVRVLSACGHTREFVVAEVDSPDVPERGEVLPCSLCDSDPIEGEAQVPVELVTMKLRKRLVPLGPDGELVPGASVKPGGIVPKVEAR